MPVKTIQVPKGKHGAIIGPRGAHINGIRDELGVRVTIPRDDVSCGVMVSEPARHSHRYSGELSSAVGFGV